MNKEHDLSLKVDHIEWHQVSHEDKRGCGVSGVERLEEIHARILDLKRKSRMPNEVLTFNGWEPVVPVFTKDIEHLFEQAEQADMLLHENIEIRKGYQERAKRVEELEKVSVDKFLNRLKILSGTGNGIGASTIARLYNLAEEQGFLKGESE